MSYTSAHQKSTSATTTPAGDTLGCHEIFPVGYEPTAKEIEQWSLHHTNKALEWDDSVCQMLDVIHNPKKKPRKGPERSLDVVAVISGACVGIIALFMGVMFVMTRGEKG